MCLLEGKEPTVQHFCVAPLQQVEIELREEKLAGQSASCYADSSPLTEEAPAWL